MSQQFSVWELSACPLFLRRDPRSSGLRCFCPELMFPGCWHAARASCPPSFHTWLCLLQVTVVQPLLPGFLSSPRERLSRAKPHRLDKEAPKPLAFPQPVMQTEKTVAKTELLPSRLVGCSRNQGEGIKRPLEPQEVSSPNAQCLCP